MKKSIRIQLLLFLSLVLAFTAASAVFANGGRMWVSAPRGALTARGETAATSTEATPAEATPDKTMPDKATPADPAPAAGISTEATPDEAVPSSAAKTENGFTYIVSNGQAVIIAADATVKGNVTVPGQLGGVPVGVIGMGAFKGNEGIVSVALPDSVSQIDEQAFRGCPLLEKLTLGKSLAALPESAVADCGSLKELVFSADSDFFAVDADGAVYNAARTELLAVSRGIAGEFTVPASVALVRGGAFRGCDQLTKVTFAGANTVIGEGAFRDCAALTAAVLPENLKTVPAEAFDGCSALTEAVLPSSVEVIGARAFAGCEKLNVSLPGGLKTLGDGAFAGCSALTSGVLPDGCAAIGKGAFADCAALENISLPTGLTAVPEEMFLNCAALKNVDHAAAVDTVGARAFYGCAALEKVGDYTNFIRVGLDAFTGTKWFNEFAGGALNGKNLLLLYKPSVSEKKMTVGENITAIAPGALRGCTALEEIILPAGLLSIGESAFESCSSLQSIEIPAGVTEIGDNAFRDCAALKTASFDGVAKIGENAFSGTAFAAAAEAGRQDLTLGANLLRASVAYPATATEAEKAAPRDAATATDPAGAAETDPVKASGTDAATATDGGKAAAAEPDVSTGSDAGKASGTDAGKASGTDAGKASGYVGGKGDGPDPVYSVSAGVKSIASGAFRGMELNGRLVLPEGLVILSDGAFDGLTGLKHVNCPSTLTYGDAALEEIEKNAGCPHTTNVLRYEDLKKCEAPWFSGCTYCVECAALLDRGALKEPTGHRFAKTAENGDTVTITCSVCGKSKTITAAEYNTPLTDSDKARAEGEYVIITEGLTASQLLAQCPAGTVILDAEKHPVEGDANVGSGKTVLFPSSRSYTVVLYGDGDGDGAIAPADARIALRRSVRLDEAVAWRDKACHVINDGEAAVSSEDARLILRASVGLEDATAFGKVAPPQPGEDPSDPGKTTDTDPGENPGTDPGGETPSNPGKEDPPAPSVGYKTGAYVCVSPTGVYLRSQHNTGASPMDIINSGESITVKEVFCDSSSGRDVYWGKITHRGVTGWVQLEYFEAL